jgi:hypothetical protein
MTLINALEEMRCTDCTEIFVNCTSPQSARMSHFVVRSFPVLPGMENLPGLYP